MEPGRKKQQEFFNETAAKSPEANPRAPSRTISYAKELRALGQAIEKHSFSFLNLELESGIYIVRGRIKAPKKSRPSFSRFIRDLIYCAITAPQAKNPTGEIDLHYTPEDIEKLELEGREKRKKSNRMPNPHSLSQILRSAGFYLDNRAKLSLVGITIEYPWVSLRFKTGAGRLEQAKQHLQYFYECWVKMYLQRSHRPGSPLSTKPSLGVTWEEIKKQTSAF